MSPSREMLVLPIPASKLIRVGESVTTHRHGSKRPHKGLDLFAPIGTPVLAARGGRVLRIVKGTLSGRLSQQRAGSFVDVLGDDARVYRYLHLGADIAASQGQSIGPGQRIGSIGDRSTSGIKHTSPHLHFEICLSDFDQARGDYGERIDPKTVLPLGGFAMDWKGILDTALGVVTPIAAAAANAEAPGTGVAVTAAGGLLTGVVNQYVPDESSAPAPPAPAVASSTIATTPAPAAMPAASVAAPSKSAAAPATPAAAAQVASAASATQDPAAQAAASFLLKKGLSPTDVAQRLQGPPASTSTASAGGSVLSQLQPQDGAAVVHGVLQAAGWHDDARQAILNGPYALADYLKPKPDLSQVPQAGDYDHNAILKDGLHDTTEMGGVTPTAYHATEDAHVDGLGDTTELPELEEA